MDTMEVERAQGLSPDVTVFRLRGSLVLGTMFDLQTALRDPDLKNVIIDLAGVPYMDSGGLGMLLGQWSHSQRSGQKFALSGITPRVLTIFQMTRVDTVMPIFATPEDAEASFGKAAAA